MTCVLLLIIRHIWADEAMLRFIACQQALTLPGVDERHAILADADFWDDLSTLAHDEIIGVRISLARFTSLLYGTFQLDSHD